MPRRTPRLRRRDAPAGYPDLKTWRLETGTRQIDLAPRLGIRQPALSKIENGKAEPDLDLALRIVALTGVPLSSLILPRDLRRVS